MVSTAETPPSPPDWSNPIAGIEVVETSRVSYDADAGGSAVTTTISADKSRRFFPAPVRSSSLRSIGSSTRTSTMSNDEFSTYASTQQDDRSTACTSIRDDDDLEHVFLTDDESDMTMILMDDGCSEYSSVPTLTESICSIVSWEISSEESPEHTIKKARIPIFFTKPHKIDEDAESPYANEAQALEVHFRAIYDPEQRPFLALRRQTGNSPKFQPGQELSYRWRNGVEERMTIWSIGNFSIGWYLRTWILRRAENQDYIRGWVHVDDVNPRVFSMSERFTFLSHRWTLRRMTWKWKVYTQDIVDCGPFDIPDDYLETCITL